LNKKIFLLFISILFSLSAIHSLAQDDPLWVLVEKGKAEMRKKEYGNALKYFKDAISVKEEFPEVYILIGDIYKLSDNKIAKEYYEEAYKYQYFFEIPADKYRTLYKLAYLYKEEGNYREYEIKCKEILHADTGYFSEYFDKTKKELDDDYLLKDDFINLFKSKGLNRLLILHRITGYQQMTQAHAELGWYYYKTGMYKKSVNHSLFAVISIISEAFQELRRIQPLYEYSRLNNFLNTALTFDYIKKYLLEESDIYKILYYLACAEYAYEEDYLKAKGIWQVIADSPVWNEYKSRANKQIQSPWTEKLLIDIPVDENYNWQ